MHKLATLPFALLAVSSVLASGCASSSETEASEPSEDELVATFDRQGRLDLNKPSHILLVGDSDKLGELPLHAAIGKARRYVDLYPNDQIVLFVTKDVRDATVVATGASIVQREAFPNVALSDLRRLSARSLVSAMDRFVKIASIDFFGHSSPFGALLEAEGDGRTLAADSPSNTHILADNFARDRHPYVTLNGCNGGVETASELSRAWRVPVSGALTASNFQALMEDGRYYVNDEGRYPAELRKARQNEVSFKTARSCSGGNCIRMKPEDAPYWGVWSRQDTGFQYGLNYYKFFCNYPGAETDGTCDKGMITSLYSFPSIKPIDASSSDADVREVLADFFCNEAKDPAWFDTCKAGLESAVENGTAFSPMKGANDYTLECDFVKCEQKFRCDMVEGVPQKKTCAWVDAACRDDQTAAQCRKKNTKKQMTTREYARYVAGHAAVRRH